MKQRYLGLILLGKGAFASVALLMLLGTESNASLHEPQLSSVSQQIVYSRPGSPSAVANENRQTSGPRWVF